MPDSHVSVMRAALKRMVSELGTRWPAGIGIDALAACDALPDEDTEGDWRCAICGAVSSSREEPCEACRVGRKVWVSDAGRALEAAEARLAQIADWLRLAMQEDDYVQSDYVDAACEAASVSLEAGMEALHLARGEDALGG